MRNHSEVSEALEEYHESAIGALTLAIDERDAERARAEKAEAERDEARRDLLAVAHAIGIVHEPDTGQCWPGPIEEIVRAIKDAKHEAREADSERARADRLEAKLSELTDGGEK